MEKLIPVDLEKIDNEVVEHLSNNDYHFIVEGNTILILEDKLEWLLTILDDRKIQYTVKA